MQKMEMCSASTLFSNSKFLFNSFSLHSSAIGINGSSTKKQKNNTHFCLSSSFSLLSLSHYPSLSVSSNIDSNNRLQTSAFKKGTKGGTALVEMGNSDEDDDDFFDFDDEFDFADDGGDDDEDDEGMILPLDKMKKWLQNKPRGFGEGKAYDTSIEDKLLEEIEQSRQAQIVNVNNLKNNAVNSASNKADHCQNNKVAEVAPSGIRVRVVNLPKKKNIHRDLKAAFNGVPGIINISPAVSGNKKTKDPICKGFAFVYFKREVDATRFVHNFSGHNLMFGRVQKQIKCEMMNLVSHNPAQEELSDNDSATTEVAVSGLVDHPNSDFHMSISSLDVSLDNVSDEVDYQDDEFDFEFDSVELGEGRDHLNVICEPEASSGDYMEQTIEHSADSIYSTRLERIRALEKKLLARGKQEQPRVSKEQKGQKVERIRSNKKKVLPKGNQQEVQKLDIPGSAKRLKIREKALLTGVFSRYGLKTALTSKEES